MPDSCRMFAEYAECLPNRHHTSKLQDLTEKVILTRIGTTERSIFYELAKT